MTDRDHKRRYKPTELNDVITGEVFVARAHNHYEDNDGLPAAPEVELPRLSTRERVELLTRGGFNLHDIYRPGAEHQADDLDVLDETDEDEAPLTRDEAVYLAQVAEREEDTRRALAAEQQPPPTPGPENASAASPAPASPLVAPEEPRPASPQPAPR